MHTAIPLSTLALALLFAAPATAHTLGAGPGPDAVLHYAEKETVGVIPAVEGAEATTIWIVESGGDLYIRTNRRSAWGNAVESAGALSLNPKFSLQVERVDPATGKTESVEDSLPDNFTAARVTDSATMDSVTAAFRNKYGFADVMAGLLRAIGGGPRIFRLQPKLPEPEAAEEPDAAEEIRAEEQPEE